MRKIIGFLVLAFSVLTSTSNSNDNLDMREAVSKRDVIINNISKPFTYAEIEEIVMLKAYDEVFGDLTEKIVLVNNQYAGNETVIGFFELEYEVTNDYGVKTTYVLIVYNVDFEKPEIIGNNDPTMISYKEDFNLDNIIKLFKVVDNSSQDITLTVIRNTYQINTIGYFEVELEAKDGSGNVTTIIHSIHVFDNIQPEIIDEHLRHETNGDEIDDTFLLQGLSAYDEIDGNLTKQITIKSKTFLSSDKMRVNYEVMDSSSNTVQYYRDYIITSNKEKLVGTSVVKANIGAFLKIEGVINQVIKELSLDTHQYAVIKDEYSGNEEKEGEYTIVFEIITKEGNKKEIERIIKVEIENKSDDDDSFIDMLKNNIDRIIIIVLVIVIIVLVIKKRRGKNEKK